MKKLSVILILIGFFFLTGCIVKKTKTQKKEEKPVSVVSVPAKPEIRAMVPEKKVEATKRPEVVSEEVKMLKTEIAELKTEIAVLKQTAEDQKSGTTREIRRYAPDESVHAEVKTERGELEQAEEPVYYEPETFHYWRPFIFPTWFDLALNPFWYYYYRDLYCWNWYSGLYYWGSYLGWHPFWSWTRPFYYSYYSGYYGHGYDPFYRGRTVVYRDQLKGPRYQSQISRISRTSVKGTRSISQKSSSVSSRYSIKPHSYISGRPSRISPGSTRLASRSSSFSRVSSRSFGSFRSSSRPAPSRSFSRSSGSIRRK